MSTTLDADIRVEDFEYRPGLLARLYRPAGDGPFPAIVEVHGGAWVNSDRLNNAPLAETLAAEGIMTLSLDFRMPPEAGYPASLQDINYGVRWFKSRAREFGARADRVGLFGTSSGGHQVLLAAMRPFDARYAALPLTRRTRHRCARGIRDFRAGACCVRWCATGLPRTPRTRRCSTRITASGVTRRRWRKAARR